MLECTGTNANDIYNGMKAGTFPKSVPIGKRTVGWVESEIHNWIAERIKARDLGKAVRNSPGPGRGHTGERAGQVAA